MRAFEKTSISYESSGGIPDAGIRLRLLAMLFSFWGATSAGSTFILSSGQQSFPFKRNRRALFGFLG
jgi:hypothetical protein